MNKHVATKTDFLGKYLVLAVAGMTLAGSTAIAQAKAAPHATQSSDTSAKPMAFDVVSIQPSKHNDSNSSRFTREILPDGYRAISQPMSLTIILASFPHIDLWSSDTIPVNLPSWINDQYDIQAKVAPADMAEWQKQGPRREMLRMMLQTMLADRCKLVSHWVPSQTSGYALVVGKHGTKLKKAKSGEPIPPNGIPLVVDSVEVPGATFFPFRRGEDRTALPFYQVSMEVLAEWLSENVRMQIVDHTGLAGNYDIVLNKQEENKREMEDGLASEPGPSIEWDLEALGLKLVPVKIPMEKLVIDHIERPSED
jgi:uncharacterized protein (TIGR03435 family)